MRVTIDLPEEWADALRFAAKDLGAQTSTPGEAIRRLVGASSAVWDAAERAGITLPDLPPARWGGKRENAGRPEKSERSDNLSQDAIESPAAEESVKPAGFTPPYAGVKHDGPRPAPKPGSTKR